VANGPTGCRPTFNFDHLSLRHWRCGANGDAPSSLVGLRWRSVNLLEAKIEVRETFVRGHFTTPKSRASGRVVELGPRTLVVLEEEWQRSAYRANDDLVFGHPTRA
jgi:hypothetical protein